MRISITICCDNAAFEEQPEGRMYAVALALRELASRIAAKDEPPKVGHMTVIPLADVNGNTIGLCKIATR